MDVRMPDGLIITNVPDNITKAELLEKLNRNNIQTSGTEQPTATTEPAPEESSDFMRGIKSYPGQTKEILGGGKTLLGKAIGSRGLMERGIQDIQEAQTTQQQISKPTDTFDEAYNQGVLTVLTDWLPYQAGIGAANIGETLALMGVGAFAGSVAGPGGAVGGGATGLLSKQLVKKGIKEAAEQIARDEGLDASKAFVENAAKKEVSELLAAGLGKQGAKAYGANVGIGTGAALHGAGETTSRTVEEKITRGEDPTDLDLYKLVPAATAHALTDFVGDKLGLAALGGKLSKGGQSVILDVAKNMAIAGATQVPPEVVQSALERYSADLSLDDSEAIQEYINTTAAAFGMAAVPGGIGGVRAHYAQPAVPKQEEPEAQQLEPEQPTPPTASDVEETDALLLSMQENIEGKSRGRTTRAKTDKQPRGAGVQVSGRPEDATAEGAELLDGTAVGELRDSTRAAETRASGEPDTLSYTPEQIAAMDTRRVAKQEYEVEKQAKLDEFNAKGPERLAAMDIAEETRKENVYPVNRMWAPPASKEVIKNYNASRKISDKEGELITLPAWNSLNKIERDLYVHTAETKGPEEALKKLTGFRVGDKETKLDKVAFVYETNRDTANKQLDIKFPSWQQLPPEARNQFSLSLPKPSMGVISGKGINDAYSTVADTLEQKNIAYRGMGPTAVSEAQTKLQERGSIQQVEKERGIEEAIKGRKKWDDVLAQSATEVPGAIATSLEEPVVGAAKPIVTSGVVANKLLNTIKKVDGDVAIEFGTLPKDTAGQYDPDTNTITIDQNNLYQEQDGKPVFSRSLSEVVNHEMSHYALDHIADNLNKASPAQKKAMKQLQEIHKSLVNVPIGQNQTVGGEYNIGTFKEFLAEALSNAAFQRTLAGIKVVKLADKARWKELSQAERKLFGMVQESDNMFSAFIKRVARALGFAPGQAPVLEKVLSNIENVLEDSAYKTPDLSEGMKGEGVSFAARKKAPKGMPTTEQVAKDYTTKIKPRRTTRQIISHLFTHEAKEWAETKFQNSRAAIKRWQADFERAGKIKIGTKDFNNVYDMIVTSFGKANFLMKEYLDEHTQRLQKAVDALMEASGRSLDETLGWLHLYAEALHEPERRAVKYIFNVPLSTAKNLKYEGKKLSAADIREKIVDELSKGVTEAKAVQYRKYLDWIVANYADATGVSPSNYKTTDINASVYNVIARRTSEEIQQRLADLDNDPYKAQIMNVIKSLKPLQEATMELNKKGGFWNDQVDGIVAFYGFDNYVPFKGKPESQSTTNVTNLEINGARLSNDLKPFEGPMGGRETESDNPILQTLKESTISVARAGRKGLTESIKNAVKQKLIPGKVVKTYSFEERYKGLVDENDFTGRNRILHYNDNGSIDVIQINDEKLLEAIRRTYQESHPLLDIVNSWTSLVGQSHTRYNPSFPLMDFVRNTLTNAYVLAVELSPMEAASYLGHIVTNTVPNMLSIGRVSRMYGKGDINGIRNLAKKNKNVADVLEYLEHGGQISVVSGLSVQGQLEQLSTDLNKSKVAKTKDQIDKVFDIWVNTFEIATRAAAYNAVKTSLISKGMSEEAARIKATSYVKGLANFEEIGEWGKAMGAAFMFFRPSATGAVRAMQALGPAVRDWDTVKKEIPEAITKDAVALETYRKDYMRQKAAAQKVSAALVGMGMVTYAMSGMLSGDDDEDKNKAFTDDMSRWTRYVRFHYGTEDKVIQIPWGFGLGSLPAMGAQMAAMTNNPTFSTLDAVGNIANIALDSFAPLPVSRMSPVDNPQAWLIDSVMPSLLRPFVEHTMNVNGLGQHIYNSQSRMGDAFTGGDNVPDLYKDAAAYLATISEGDIDWSPNTLYFFANSYLDGASRIAHNGYGVGLTLAGQKEFDIKHDIPLIDSFISNRSTLATREFVDTKADVLNIERKVNMFKSNPELYIDYITNNPGDEAIVDLFNKETASSLKDLQSMAKGIRIDRDLSPKEKSEMLRENKQLQDMVKANITSNVEMLKQFYED